MVELQIWDGVEDDGTSPLSASTPGRSKKISESMLKQIAKIEKNLGDRMSRPRKMTKRNSKVLQETTFIQRPPIFKSGTELQISTIVDRVPWRPSIELLPHFNQIVFMTVVTAPPDDIYFTQSTPAEELREACMNYFMSRYSFSEVSVHQILLKPIFRSKLSKKRKAISVTQANLNRSSKC